MKYVHRLYRTLGYNALRKIPVVVGLLSALFTVLNDDVGLTYYGMSNVIQITHLDSVTPSPTALYPSLRHPPSADYNTRCEKVFAAFREPSVTVFGQHLGLLVINSPTTISRRVCARCRKSERTRHGDPYTAHIKNAVFYEQNRQVLQLSLLCPHDDGANLDPLPFKQFELYIAVFLDNYLTTTCKDSQCTTVHSRNHGVI